MRVIVAMLLIAAATAGAATEGLDAVIARRKTMRKIDRPVRQIKQGDAILSLYDDGRLETNAVRIVKLPGHAAARVEALRDDQATLAAARSLAAKVRRGHPKAAAGLADAELVATADQVLDTTGRDSATAGLIGALVGAAAAVAGKGNGKGKDKPEPSSRCPSGRLS